MRGQGRTAPGIVVGKPSAIGPNTRRSLAKLRIDPSASAGELELIRPLHRSVYLLVLAICLAAPGIACAGNPSTPATKVSELRGSVNHQRTFELSRPATHVALHWRGRRDARVSVAFERSGAGFGRWHRVHLDEIGMDRPGNETYGAIMLARNAGA